MSDLNKIDVNYLSDLSKFVVFAVVNQRLVRERRAYRCSLENFGDFRHVDAADGDAVRHVSIVPLYAISNILYSGFSEG